MQFFETTPVESFKIDFLGAWLSLRYTVVANSIISDVSRQLIHEFVDREDF
jgi:hypothetical protein